MIDPAILDRVAQTIEARKDADPTTSYVAKLLHEGQDKWFHCLVLLAHHDLGPQDVLNELRRREGISGIDEKAARKAG